MDEVCVLLATDMEHHVETPCDISLWSHEDYQEGERTTNLYSSMVEIRERLSTLPGQDNLADSVLYAVVLMYNAEWVEGIMIFANRPGGKKWKVGNFVSKGDVKKWMPGFVYKSWTVS